MVKSFFFSILIITTSLIYAQQPEVKLLTSEDIAKDPSLHLTDEDSLKTIVAKKDTIRVNSQDLINLVSQNDTLTSVKTTPITANTKLQDDPKLAAIDKEWMELIKQSELYDTSMFELDEKDYKLDESLSTEVLKQRLATIDAKTPFHVTYNPELERLIKTYLKTRPKALASIMGKAKYYFPLFEEKLDQYDIPLEMKYLAIVESALRPKAKSRVGATGLWQFMYQTGKQYGLNVSSYVDQRQDPLMATEAACKFLADLYDIFNDWDLALAAYNSGPGNVSKAMRRSGGNKNYWNLRPYLPRETANYVPIFYATLYLFEYAEEHNLKASSAYTLHYFEVDSIHISQQLTFEQIQKTTGIDENLIEFLNPSYKLNIIPKLPNKPQILVLPKEYIGLFLQNESQIYAYAQAEEAKREKPLPKYFEMNQRIRYRVRSGDYLGKIASKFGVSVKKIKRWNGLKSSRLRIGQRLTIYPKKLAGVNNQKTNPKKRKKRKIKTPKGKYTFYIVKEGDSFWSIAQKYPNVSVEQIKDWNGIWGNKLAVGTKLKIYKG